MSFWDTARDFTSDLAFGGANLIRQGGELIGNELGNAISSNLMGMKGVRATDWGNVAEGAGRIGAGAASYIPIASGASRAVKAGAFLAPGVAEVGIDAVTGNQPVRPVSMVQTTQQRNAPAWGFNRLPVPPRPPGTDPRTMGTEGNGLNGAKNPANRAAAQQAASAPFDPNMLPPESPEALAAYRAQRRAAERQLEAAQAMVQLNNRNARQAFRQARTDINRSAQGGAQDLATALAYLGMDTAPALYDVSKDAINSGAQEAIGMARADKASVIADGRSAITKARILRDQMNADADMQRAAAKQAQVNALFGGQQR